MPYELLDNDDAFVDNFLKSFCNFNKNVLQVENKPIIIQRNFDKKRVAILSGGGSGHEPLSAGFVGKGMLTASVSGRIFTSPGSSDILHGIMSVGKDNKYGVLLIVLNYTGDRLNFNIAANRAKQLGIKVESVVVGEDCSMKEDIKFAGRRGLAGASLIYKIAGGMSEEGLDLMTIKTEIENIINKEKIGTIGISFSGCNLPFSNEKSFEVPSNSYILGLGIHGETGVKVEKMTSVQQCVETMANYILQPNINSVSFKTDDEVVLLINNLGFCHPYEMYSFADKFIQHLESMYEVIVKQCYCGSYVTSLDMKGISATVLNVRGTKLLKYLNMPTEAAAWIKSIYYDDDKFKEKSIHISIDDINQIKKKNHDEIGDLKIKPEDIFILDNVVVKVCDDIIENEDYLNELDKEVGDYDCGSTAKRGAMAVRDYILSKAYMNEISSCSGLYSKLGEILETSMGGTSGGILSLLFETVAAKHYENPQMDWSLIFKESVKCVSAISNANRGDRTMLDVLFPVCDAWYANQNKPGKELISILSNVCDEAAKETIHMIPKAGRASYAQDKAISLDKPDPGAEMINIVFKSILKHVP